MKGKKRIEGLRKWLEFQIKDSKLPKKVVAELLGISIHYMYMCTNPNTIYKSPNHVWDTIEAVKDSECDEYEVRNTPTFVTVTSN